MMSEVEVFKGDLKVGEAIETLEKYPDIEYFTTNGLKYVRTFVNYIVNGNQVILQSSSVFLDKNGKEQIVHHTSDDKTHFVAVNSTMPIRDINKKCFVAVNPTIPIRDRLTPRSRYQDYIKRTGVIIDNEKEQIIIRTYDYNIWHIWMYFNITFVAIVCMLFVHSIVFVNT